MRKEVIGSATLYLARMEDALPHISGFDAILTDPPYGGNLSFDYAKRFRSKAGRWWKNDDRSRVNRHKPVEGDDKPFDPSALLALSVPTVLWGANWYSSRLPDRGGWVVWDKRGGQRDVSGADWPMSEAELAWSNVGEGIRIVRHTWFGLLRDSERGEHYHPTQKPVFLMERCVELKLKDARSILDPYMGSGPVGVACASMGKSYTGIELDEEYFEIACERIQAAYAQGRLFA